MTVQTIAVGAGRALPLQLSDRKTSFDFDSEKFDAAMQFLHQHGGITPDDLSDGEPLELTRQINSALTQALNKGVENASVKYEVPEEVVNALRENVWVFSGMKTFHELREASTLLVTETGEIKPFHRFLEDVQKIHGKYNRQYLEAEYNFATHSALMAAKWQDFAADGDRYNLQYRTAADGLVRADHAVLHGTTLPPSDPFWNSYLPPLGWNCRCTTVQVLRDDYPLSDSDYAQQQGEAATTSLAPDGSNKLAMFRFNPGKELKIFPDKHPYYPRGCTTCDKNVRLAAKNVDKSELCKVCAIVREQAKKSVDARKRAELEKAMEPMLKRSIIRYVGSGKSIKITFNKKGNKHVVDDILAGIKLSKKDLAKLHNLIKQAKYVPVSGELYKERTDNIQRFYYFFDEKRNIYYNIAQKVETLDNGKIEVKKLLYSVTDKLFDKK